MNRLQFFMIAGSLSLAACSTSSPDKKIQEDRQAVREELGAEMSLKADREDLKELRKEIPTDKQKSNDELALFLQMMGQGTEQPQAIHDRFQTLVRRKRTTFREKVKRLRDDYRENETKRRDEFLAKQKQKREDFTSGKPESKVLREFFATQEKERLRYFADERDRRSNFESELNIQSQDFESYMRGKNAEFNEQYRLYSKRFSEKPKASKAVTGETNDFDRLKEVPTTPLGTDN